MISVILPTYNREKLLMRAVNSVLKQTYADLELIVVDDASTDGTAELMAGVTDPRVRYVCQERNQGACAARNRGVMLAKGEYIAFQDSDDDWAVDKLEKQLDYLNKTGADIVFCAFRRYSDGKEDVFPPASLPEGPVSYRQLLLENLISTQTILGRKACFVQYPFDETFPRMQDWELVLRLSQSCRILYMKEPLSSVYVQADSISRKPEAGLQALEKLLEKHRGELRRNDAAAKRFAVAMAVMTRQCGRNPARAYLKMLSPRLKPVTNLYLLAHSARAAVKGS